MSQENNIYLKLAKTFKLKKTYPQKNIKTLEH